MELVTDALLCSPDEASDESVDVLDAVLLTVTGATSLFELVEKRDFGDSTLGQVAMEDLV